MKTVALICAMEKEILYIREKFGATLLDEKFTVYEATESGKKIIACVSGIGKVNSAVATQRIIDRYSPDAVINVGIAGGIDKSLKVLDMVIADKVFYHDFHPMSLLEEDENLKTSIFLSDKNLVEIANKSLSKMKEQGEVNNFKTGTIVSGDCFVEDDALSRHLREDLFATCVEMEGASIAQTCLINKVPFLVIRSISDFADNNAGMSYDTFSTTAANQAGRAMEEIIKGL